jgi:hypothetical protein
MLIDNKHELTRGQETTIFQYLEINISEGGRFDFVTGYFTISALSKLTYDECKIVDPEIEELISRKDYEKATIEELAEREFKK